MVCYVMRWPVMALAELHELYDQYLYVMYMFCVCSVAGMSCPLSVMYMLWYAIISSDMPCPVLPIPV